MQNENYNTNLEINECTSRGICSISPSIVALEELSLEILQQLSYYILLLEKSGAYNKNIKCKIVNYLASLVSINEFNDNQLFSIIKDEYYLLEDTKKNYKTLCKNKGLAYKDLKSIENFSQFTTLSNGISIGEKLTQKKYLNYSITEKNLSQILLIILKSICTNIVQIEAIATVDEKIYKKILKTLIVLRNKKIDKIKIKNYIYKVASINKEIQLLLCENIFQNFGNIEKTKVSHSTSKGKAILVSGNNFSDLINILIATKDENIDVYTHSNLLIAHSFEKFKNFKNLKGHYGNKTENCIIDFATFPGSILLTKNTQKNSDYYYRGRLFSSDFIVPDGVIKISNNDYTEIISGSLKAKGFKKGKIKNPSEIGFNLSDIKKIFKDLKSKINSNNISKLYIIDGEVSQEKQASYFTKLLQNLKKDEYAICFDDLCINKNNILTINIANYEPLSIYIISILSKFIDIKSKNIEFIFAKCENSSISNMLSLKKERTKNITFSACSPNNINPSLYSTLCQEFDLKTIY